MFIKRKLTKIRRESKGVILIVIVECHRNLRFSQSNNGQFHLCHYIIESAEHSQIIIISIYQISSRVIFPRHTIHVRTSVRMYTRYSIFCASQTTFSNTLLVRTDHTSLCYFIASYITHHPVSIFTSLSNCPP